MRDLVAADRGHVRATPPSSGRLVRACVARPPLASVIRLTRPILRQVGPALPPCRVLAPPRRRQMAGLWISAQVTRLVAMFTRRVERDPFVDVLRVFAVIVIVGLHWLMPELSYDGERLIRGNTLAQPGMWPITWLCQVMPLIFFAGGAAAAYSWRTRARNASGTGAARWTGQRLYRLALPVLPLAAIWLPLPYLLLLLGLPTAPVVMAGEITGRLLWFLAVYVLFTTVTPALIALHRRWRGVEIAVLAAGAVAVDVLRFGLLGGTDGAVGDAIGYVNVAFVWGALYQLGIAYAHGRLAWLHRSRACVAAGIGLLVTAVGVAAGPYPASMIGMPGSPVSAMNPPSAALLGIATLQLGLAFAMRHAIRQWASGRTVSHGLAWMSQRLLTIYVWHTPALVLVSGIAVVGLGWSTPELFSADWRREIQAWLAGLALVLAALVHVFSRVERRRANVDAPAWRVGAAAVLIGPGLLELTIDGFDPTTAGDLVGPATASLAIVSGVTLLRVPRRRRDPGTMPAAMTAAMPSTMPAAIPAVRSAAMPAVRSAATPQPPAARTPEVGTTPPPSHQPTGSHRGPERESVGA
ncbi:acyltransferase [Actinobacteria bacterium YIM 96077]|nr:acyltransferase [Actinobacteria bacterium YIM 96077]